MRLRGENEQIFPLFLITSRPKYMNSVTMANCCCRIRVGRKFLARGVKVKACYCSLGCRESWIQLLFWCDLGHALWFSTPECGLWYLTVWLPFSAVDILNSFIQFYTESRSVIIAKEITLDSYVKKSFDTDSCS